MEYVVSNKQGRPLFVAEGDLGSINKTMMRHSPGFDGTIRPLAEVEAEATGYDTRQRERLSTALQRLGVSGDGLAVRDLTESRASHLRRLPHYKIPVGGVPSRSGSGAAPSSSTQAAELRERAKEAFGRLGVSETVAVNGL